jgi:hypothetical protein
MSGKRIVLVAALLLAGCTADRPAAAPASPAPATTPPASLAPAATGCGKAPETGPLPTWARAGFSDDGAGVPHVFGRKGDILGVLFGRTLSAPPAADRNNKILWVSRLPLIPSDPLKITATLDGTAETADRTVPGGPGPSIVDLPKPGCWHLALAWSGHTETIDLTYQAPTR